MTTEDLQISWLHCNICHKAFDSHNSVQRSGDRLTISQSNLYFYFTGCGHFFCENCLKSGQSSSRCRVCGEQSQSFKLQSSIPDKVAMYMKPPIGLLEDSLSIMMFQLDNANKLINALRTKISSQKDLLLRAKQEVAQVKDLKQRIKVLEGGTDLNGRSSSRETPFNPAQSVEIDPNETFQIPTEFRRPKRENERNNFQLPQPPPFSPYINNKPYSHQSYNHIHNRTMTSAFIMPPESPLIHAPGRLSLKSPSLSTVINNPNNSIVIPSPSAYKPSSNLQQQNYSRTMKRPRPVIGRKMMSCEECGDGNISKHKEKCR